jgi:pimeloyl-ACP methyl ester carboxylesterase
VKQEVFELHALLEKATVHGPFVLVGHSLGGLAARLYADQYGSEVVGVVLVDALHEDSVQFNLRVNRWVRIRELAVKVKHVVHHAALMSRDQGA